MFSYLFVKKTNTNINQSNEKISDFYLTKTILLLKNIISYLKNHLKHF